MADDRQQIIQGFEEAVNMTPKELEEWLETEKSKSVGQSDAAGASPKATSLGAGSSR